MAKTTGFLEFGRKPPKKRPTGSRIFDWNEVYEPWPEKDARAQAARCMDCGVPFCNRGCPLGNLIPEWNDLVYHGDWKVANARLHATNNFPEFTGRICPAPCEPACTLSINQEPVTIEMIEKAIVERAFAEEWIKPEPPTERTGKHVAVVGSGPAGLAAAQQLNRAGHTVTVFERNEVAGGLLSLGIPDFKLEKWVVSRRLDLMEKEGVLFSTKTEIGIEYSTDRLLQEHDAICLAVGSTVARDLPVPGRELKGVHFAMEYLTQQNRLSQIPGYKPDKLISAEGKKVVILGGGDTGADCLGTVHRQGASSVLQFEIMPAPPFEREKANPWPEWPLILRSSSAHDEGGRRDYGIATTSFEGRNGRVKRLNAKRVQWQPSGNFNRINMEPVPGTAFTVEADLILLALGFSHPKQTGFLAELGVRFDSRGNVIGDTRMMTNVNSVFVCGDAQRGQSLVVHAIAGGRSCARAIDEWLMGQSSLPKVTG